MNGLMQAWPLTVDRILDHAALNHPTREIVSQGPVGTLERTDYASLRVTAHAISDALRGIGLVEGDRVAGQRHSLARNPPLRCVTHRVRPATRKASCTATARTCCTRSPPISRMFLASLRATS